MSASDGGRVTQLLAAWSEGDQRALDELMPLVYGELRRLAQSHLRRERPGHTLQRTVLVHEAFLRLVNQKEVRWQGRAHFLGLASRLMRRILVDHARARLAAKRGDGARHVSFDDAIALPDADVEIDADPEALLATRDQPTVDLVALDNALQQLEAMDPRQGKVVELRFFGGLTVEETAQALDISVATVKREWAVAKAWLHRQLGDAMP
jgi:RNA polymerase sigma factor (TIGR02999 family)